MVYKHISQFLKFFYPEGFEQINEDRSAQVAYIKDFPCMLVRNQEQSIIITVGCTTTGPLAFVTGSLDQPKNMEKKVQKIMAPYGYVFDGFVQKSFGGKTLEGIRYFFIDRGIPMYGESYGIVINKKFIHCINFYSGKQNLEQNLATWDSVASKAEWKE